MRRQTPTYCTLILAFTLATTAALAQLPDGVEKRTVDLWSDGTRLTGDIFEPPGFSADDQRPAIVLSHGWGGTRDHLSSAYAPYFAAEGFVVLTIDYRGWGDSDSRLVLLGEQPERDEDGNIQAKVHAVREVVDPLDQTEDIRNAITYIAAEPGVDPDRIGLWGSSYSGGHVIYVAAQDDRVKVTVSQVGSMDSKGIFTAGFEGGPQAAAAMEAARVRGDDLPYAAAPPAEGLRGTPDYTRMRHYSPREVAHRVQAAALIIDAAEEELFDIREHGQVVYNLLRHRVPSKRVVIDGIQHYGIYREALDEARKLAIEWYKEHL